MATKLKSVSFEKFLREKLSHQQFENLEMALKVSPHRRTKILNDPRVMTIDEVKTISKLVKEPVEFLINSFNAGASKITIGEYRKYLPIIKK